MFKKKIENLFYNFKNENGDNALHILAESNADNFNFLINKLHNLNNEFNNQQLTPLMISLQTQKMNYSLMNLLRMEILI